VPVSAGSVSGGGVVATVAGVVGTGVGTGTGTGDVHPAAMIPTNRTAQSKNGKDFIFTEYH
jgi:sorbitol-specific phosphotransferase system component IIBC